MVSREQWTTEARGARQCYELGGGVHGGSALVRPESEGERGRAREGAKSE